MLLLGVLAYMPKAEPQVPLPPFQRGPFHIHLRCSAVCAETELPQTGLGYVLSLHPLAETLLWVVHTSCQVSLQLPHESQQSLSCSHARAMAKDAHSLLQEHNRSLFRQGLELGWPVAASPEPSPRHTLGQSQEALGTQLG